MACRSRIKPSAYATAKRRDLGDAEIAVISLNDIVESEAIRIAGDEQNEAIINWLQKNA